MSPEPGSKMSWPPGSSAFCSAVLLDKIRFNVWASCFWRLCVQAGHVCFQKVKTVRSLNAKLFFFIFLMTFSYLCNLICITFANKPGFFLLQICKPCATKKTTKNNNATMNNLVTLSAARLYVGWRSATERSPLQYLLQCQCEFSPVVLWSRDSSALPCPFSASPASGTRRRRIEMKKKKNTKLKKQASKEANKQTNSSAAV